VGGCGVGVGGVGGGGCGGGGGGAGDYGRVCDCAISQGRKVMEKTQSAEVTVSSCDVTHSSS